MRSESVNSPLILWLRCSQSRVSCLRGDGGEEIGVTAKVFSKSKKPKLLSNLKQAVSVLLLITAHIVTLSH